MTVTDPHVRAVRDALLPAVERDLARRRRRPGRRLAVPLAICGTLGAGTGIAAATGLIFADPKPAPVPAVAEWQYFSHDPSDPTGRSGPVLRRPKAQALARANAMTEAALKERGITARCGTYSGHPLACYLPDGQPVAPPVLEEALYESGALRFLEGSRDNYEVRPLTEADARRWLCEHPQSAPGTAAREEC